MKKRIWSLVLCTALVLVLVGMILPNVVQAETSDLLPAVTFYEGDSVTYGGESVALVDISGNLEHAYIIKYINGNRGIRLNLGYVTQAEIDQYCTYNASSYVGPEIKIIVGYADGSTTEIPHDGWEINSDGNGGYSYRKEKTFLVKNYPYGLPNLAKNTQLQYSGQTQTVTLPALTWRPDNAVAEGIYANFTVRVTDENGAAVSYDTQSGSVSVLNPGTYTVTYTFDPASRGNAEWWCVREDTSLENGWTKVGDGWQAVDTITVQPIDLSTANAQVTLGEALTYNGTEQTQQVTGVTANGIPLVEGTDYTISGNTATNGGDYTLSITGMGNFTGSISEYWSIKRCPLTADKLEFVDDVITKVYDGSVSSTAKVQVRAGVAGNEDPVAVEGEAVYNSKDVQSVAKVVFTAGLTKLGNYEVSEGLTLEKAATITPKPLVVDGVMAQNRVYDGTTNVHLTPYEPAITGRVDQDQVSATVIAGPADSKNVGSRTAPITFTLTGDAAGNYVLSENSQREVRFDITAKSWSVAQAVVAPKDYDRGTAGKLESVTLEGIVAGSDVQVDYGRSTAVFDSGDLGPDHTVTCTVYLTGKDAGNYAEYATYEADGEIVNQFYPEQGVEYTVNTNGWQNGVFTVTAAEGYTLCTIEDGTWGQQLSAGAEGENTLEFYVRNAQGHISNVVTESYKIDTVAPTGGITIDERNWEGFFGAIFDKFSNKDMTVTIRTDDALSGVATVEYYESAEALDLAGMETVTGWKEGSSVNVTKEDAKRFIYYARVTDKAGNVAYLASNGTEFDTSAPKFTGIVDGGVYAVTTVVTIEDKHLAQITVNGVDYTVNASRETLTIEGNRKATYEIVAVDEAGNQTTVCFETVTTASMGESIEGLTTQNVTLDDWSDVEALLEQLEDIDLTNASAEEKAAVKALEEKAQALEKQLEELAAAADTEAINKALDVTDKNVALEDAEDLQQAIEDMEKLLEDFEGNLTEADTQSVEAALKQLQDALQVIEDAKAVQKLIDALEETAAPDDEAAIHAAADAKKAYDALSSHGKTLVKKDRLEKLAAALVDYKIIEDDGSKWTGSGDLSMTANGAYSKFTGIQVDGKDVDSRYYEAKAGSTIVTLKESYLKSLKNGKHTLTVLYTDGSAEGSFVVQLAAQTPATGDGGMLAVSAAVCMMALVGLAAALIVKRRLVK